MRMVLICLALLCGLASSLPGQAIHPVPGAVVIGSWDWRKCDGVAQWALYYNGEQVGYWDAAQSKYWPRLGHSTWGEPTGRPPIDPPQADFGVAADKIGNRPRYLIQGAEVSREDVLRTLREYAGDEVSDRSKIPPYKGKLWITAIGQKDKTDPVVRDFESGKLSIWKEKAILKTYTPDHWHVSGLGFKTDGQPTIYVQTADGQVLHRQDDYSSGADGLGVALDNAVNRVRKPDPNYDPKKDPDGRKISPGLPGLPNVPWSVPAFGGAALVAAGVLRRKQS